MPVGGIINLPFDNTTGFEVSNKIKLLGMTIDNKLECLNTVHEATYEKIVNITRFWSRFWLSLPGRINIYKTMCLSQINYIGCIISPNQEQLGKIISCMEKFVKGKLSVSQDRLYSKISMGGLGLIEVSAFIKAQQTVWIKRVLSSSGDNWREDVWNLTYGDPSILSPAIINININPIIHGIAKSFIDFKRCYYTLNDNYKKMSLLFNPNIAGTVGERRSMDWAFFRQIPAIQRETLVKIKFNNVFTNRPLSIIEVNSNATLNLNLNLLTYLRLTGACRTFVNRLDARRNSNGTSVDVVDFFGTFKKGSAAIRKIFFNGAVGTKSILQIQPVKTFLRLTEIVGNELNVRLVCSLWGEVYLPNQFREFLYKFYYNNLGINTRVSHFVQDRVRGCTFCNLASVENVPDETFVHFFFSCNTVRNIRNCFINQYFSDLNLDQNQEKALWFGFIPTEVAERKLYQIMILLVQFGFWTSKLKNRLPSYNKIDTDVAFTLATIYNINKNIFKHNVNHILSRKFLDIVRNGLH
jgi:hypothetical protein